MHMTFWWSYDLGPFLFGGLLIKSIPGLVATCLVIALMAFAFEFLKYLQAKQRQKELILRSQQLRTICPSDSSTLLTGAGGEAVAHPVNITALDRALLVGSDISLWFVLQNLGYFLMLSVMVYNGWLFVSAVFGGGTGYFVFGQRFMKLNLQNCKIIRDTYCMQRCGELEDTHPSNKDGESTPALETSPSTSGIIASCRNETVSVSVHAECHE